MSDASLEVILSKCDTYDRSRLVQVIDPIITSFKGEERFHGKTVLLKPNLVSAAGSPLGCTHGEFIRGAATWFLDRGAKVRLGDSPAFGSAARVCSKQGVTRALTGINIEMVEFATPIRKSLANGMTVTIAGESLECDLFVGLPKVKAHNQMYVTMAVKNLFGIVKGTQKAMLHMGRAGSHRNFSALLLELIGLLPPQLHLADGICAMHRTGPLHGEPFDLACVAGAENPVALDTSLLALLHLDCCQSPLWRQAARKGFTGCKRSELQFPRLRPDDFDGGGFVAPAELNPVRFNPFRFLRGVMKRIISR